MKKRLLTVFLLTLALCLCAVLCLADTVPSISVSTLTPQYNERITVTVQAPAGATAVRVWNDGDGSDLEGNRWGRWEYFDHNLSSLQAEIMCWDEGPWLVRAAYTTAAYADWDELGDLEESDWTAIGQEIILTVEEMLGVMSPPSAHLVSTTVARGEPVRLVIDALQGRDEWYFAELDVWDTDGWEQMENSHADFEAVEDVEQLYLTPHLAPGRYRLRLACEAVGYDQAWSSDLNETSLVFEVTQPQGDVPEVALYFARNTSLSFEQITFWTWAEGADHVHVTVTKEDEEFWRNDIDEDGGLQRINWSSSDSGTYIFTLTAYYGDEERAAEPFVLVQSAPYGTLQAPEISGVPGVIEVGQSVSGSVGTVANAEDYHMRLGYRTESGELETLWEGNPNSDHTFSIPGTLISRTGVYSLQAHSHALGYNGGHTDMAVYAAEQVPTGSTFLVDRTEVQTWESFSFVLYAPGMSRVMLKLNGGFWGDNEGDRLMGTMTFRNPGTYRLQAVATDNPEYGWTQIGEIITVTVTAPYGSLPVTISAPAGVAADGTGEITVTFEHGGMDYDGWVALHDRNWNEQEDALELISRTDGANADVETWRVRGDSLEPGEVYMLEAVCTPFTAGYTESAARHELVVTAGAGQAGTLSVADTDLLRCESTTVTVNVPGATALMLHFEQEHWEPIVGSSAERFCQFFNPGANQVFARYTTDPLPDGEEIDFSALSWTGMTNIVTVQVTATDTLDTPDYSLSAELVDVFEPFVVTINTVQGKQEWYMAQLIDEQDGHPVTDVFMWDENTHTIRVETSGVPSGLYFLRIWTDAVGCNSNGAEAFVGINDPEENRLYVSLPSGPVLSQDMTRVEAYAQGAASIRLTITNPDNPNMAARTQEQSGERFRDDIVFGNSEGNRHVLIEAFAPGGSVMDTYQADIQLIAPYGNRPVPRIFMDGVWTADQPLSFYVDAGDALFIYVDVVDLSVSPEQVVYEDDDIVFDPWNWGYEIPASSFIPGHRYLIEGFTSGVGYNAGEFALHINALPAGADTLTLPALLTEVEDEAFMGTAAWRITVPQGVTAIGERAFAGCANLMVADLPADLAFLPASAFSTPVNVYGEAGSLLENAVKNCANVHFIYLGE